MEPPPLSASHCQTEMLLWDNTGVIFWFNIRGQLGGAGVMVFILKGPSTPCPHLLLFPPTGTSFLLIPGLPSLLQSGPELAGSISEASLGSLSPDSCQTVPSPPPRQCQPWETCGKGTLITEALGSRSKWERERERASMCGEIYIQSQIRDSRPAAVMWGLVAVMGPRPSS